MKTKNVYVYLCRERHEWYPCTVTSSKDARRYRKLDADAGHAVSPIVKVAIPLPEEPKR